MRPIEHFPAKVDAARLAGFGEGGDDGAGARDCRGARGEHLVDDRYLVGVNGELAGEAVATGGERLGLEAGMVAEVGENRIEGHDCRRGRAGKAERAGDAIAIGEPSRGVAHRLGAKLGGEVLGAQVSPASRALAAA
jgi:hypothetical protein